MHDPLVMVQKRLYVPPAVPLKELVELAVLPNEPPGVVLSLAKLQLPVPTLGVFPPRVTDVNPQVAELTWSGPALAVVGVA